MISYLMKQIQHINIVRFLTQMLLKQFVNSCFYEKRVIYSNTANSSLVNRKYRIISNVAITIKQLGKSKLTIFYNYVFLQMRWCKNSIALPLITVHNFWSFPEWLEWFEFPTAPSSSLIWTQLNHCSVQSEIKVVVFCDSSCFYLNFNIKQNTCIIAYNNYIVIILKWF